MAAADALHAAMPDSPTGAPPITWVAKIGARLPPRFITIGKFVPPSDRPASIRCARVLMVAPFRIRASSGTRNFNSASAATSMAIACKESPPKSKKSSSRSKSLWPRTSAQAATSTRSVWLSCGKSFAYLPDKLAIGSGSPLRLILPVIVTGSASSSIKTPGTI